MNNINYTASNVISYANPTKDIMFDITNHILTNGIISDVVSSLASVTNYRVNTTGRVLDKMGDFIVDWVDFILDNKSKREPKFEPDHKFISLLVDGTNNSEKPIVLTIYRRDEIKAALLGVV